MLGLIAVILLLAGCAGYMPRFFMEGRKKKGGVPAVRLYFPLMVAFILALLLLETGISPIPALALAALAFISLLERAPASANTHDIFSRFFYHLHQAESFHSHEKKRETPCPASQMSEEEARAILNVSKTASKKEIKAAYHVLILKNHPDHGGSSYLATKINQARDRLL